MRVADGLVVTLEYTVRLASGALVDSTGQCGPVSILAGAGQLFPALEERLGNLAAGETKTFRIPPEEAYGLRDPALVRPIPRDHLPTDLEVGGEYRLKAQPGRALRFRVVEIGAEVVQADFNAPYAGEELVATVTIIDVRPPTPEEERRGRT